MSNVFMEALEFRHACKRFDETKKISDDDMTFILEAGRKSPSSFGLEAWKFLVITNDALKEKMKPLCWDQAQITTCSHLVIVLAGIEQAKPQSGTPRERIARWGLPEKTTNMYVDVYSNHLKETLSSDASIYSWTARQTYIAAANMMSAAAMIGVDSCPIEGFEKDKVEALLELDTTQYQVAMVLPFGYRVDAPSNKQRLAFDDVVEYIR